MSLTSTVRIQQALHGYDRGHRELASSVEIPPAGRHSMLVLSDLSGPRAADGFETYVTGYPVPSSDFYAVARTWLAPEMARPGCVWTHTLLIPRNALGQISFQSLNATFRRPEPPDLIGFDIALELHPGEERAGSEPEKQLLDMTGLTYGRTDPAALTSSSSLELEGAIGLLWHCQWLQLKSRFTFSTGSFAPRSLEGRSFDLQVVPLQLAPLWPWDIATYQAPRKTEAWVRFAARDLLSDRQLAGLLDDIGSASTGDLRPMAIALSLAQEAETPADVAKAIESTRDLSTPPLGSRALVILLSRDDFWPRASSASRAEALFLLPEAAVTPSLSGAAAQIASKAAAASPVDAWSLARTAWLSSNRGDLGSAVLDGVGASMQPHDLLVRTEADRDLALRLIEINPALAANTSLWTTSRGPLVLLLDAVARGTTRRRGCLDKVLASVIASNNVNAIQEAYDRWRDEFLRVLLRAVDSGDVDASGPPVLWQILRLNEKPVTDWLSKGRRAKNAYRIAALSLGPQAAIRLSRSPNPWLGLAELGVREAAFVLAIGVHSPDRKALALIQRTYGRVNDAAAHGRLTGDTWDLLEAFVPSLGFGNWDRCERLRRWVAASFVRHRWPPSSYLELADWNTSDWQLLRSLRYVAGGSDYIRMAERDR
jgi:hypothetical protein